MAQTTPNFPPPAIASWPPSAANHKPGTPQPDQTVESTSQIRGTLVGAVAPAYRSRAIQVVEAAKRSPHVRAHLNPYLGERPEELVAMSGATLPAVARFGDVPLLEGRSSDTCRRARTSIWTLPPRSVWRSSPGPAPPDGRQGETGRAVHDLGAGGWGNAEKRARAGARRNSHHSFRKLSPARHRRSSRADSAHRVSFPRCPDTRPEVARGHQGGCPRACTTPV